MKAIRNLCLRVVLALVTWSGPIASATPMTVADAVPSTAATRPSADEMDVEETTQEVRRENVVLIKRGAQYNEIFEEEFGTAYDGMTDIPLVFYEGDSPDVEDCTRLADVSITGLPPGRPAGRPVKVRLWYDRNGIIHGQAIDLETHQDVEIKIERW